MHKTGDVLRSESRVIPWLGFTRKKPAHAALLAGLLFSSVNCFAANYSCGTASANHCYGQTSWSQQPQYFGAYVDLQEPTMNCPSNCGGFVDNEIWLIDTNSQACKANSFGLTRPWK